MPKGFNQRNRLLRIIQVQDEYMKYANSGRTTRYIYRTYIYPKFLIGIATLYNYLAIPAKRDLQRLDELEQAKKGGEHENG